MSSLANTSQIILRQREDLDDDILLICPPADSLATEIKSYSAGLNVKAIAWDFKSYQCVSNQVECLFAMELPESWQPRHLILFMPKARKVLPLMLSVLGNRVISAHKVWLVGEKRGGVESAAKVLAKTAKASKIDSARHCQLWEISFTVSPDQGLEDYWQQSIISLPGTGDIEICCLPGVFSGGRLDAGTELLLNSLPQLPARRESQPARILDFGCGSGIIGLYLQLLYPDYQVEMVDVNLLAIESVRQTGQHHNIELSVWPSFGLAEVAKGLSAIVTNPPFHQGIKKDTHITRKFLMDCAVYLKKGGSLTLVANRFLPYHDWIERYVGPAEVLAENTRFRVYHAINC